MFVLGEYNCSFAVLAYNEKTHGFTEVASHQITKEANWTGGDVLVNMHGEIFVSVRHTFNESGWIVKYEYVPTGKGEDEFKEVAKTEVGDFPTRMSMSLDEQRLIVCNNGGHSVEVLSAHDLKKEGGFRTGHMFPLFAYEMHRHPTPPPQQPQVQEEFSEEMIAEIAMMAEELFLS